MPEFNVNNQNLKSPKDAVINNTSTEIEQNNSNNGTKLLGLIFEEVIDEILTQDSFTREEAAVYVKGEREISDIVKNSPKKQSIVEAFFDPNKVEREVREKYKSEHQDYAAVMYEGQKVESDYDKTYQSTINKWLEENPAPEMFEKGGLFGVKITDDYKKWKSNQMREKYASGNNPRSKKSPHDFQRRQRNSFLVFTKSSRVCWC